MFPEALIVPDRDRWSQTRLIHMNREISSSSGIFLVGHQHVFGTLHQCRSYKLRANQTATFTVFQDIQFEMLYFLFGSEADAPVKCLISPHAGLRTARNGRSRALCVGLESSISDRSGPAICTHTFGQTRTYTPYRYEKTDIRFVYTKPSRQYTFDIRSEHEENDPRIFSDDHYHISNCMPRGG